MKPQDLLKIWNRFKHLPAANVFVSRLLGFAVPYTGNLGATITKLEPGDVEIVLNPRRKHQNHLRSVHAMALANLGEFASGIALYTQLPPAKRAILVGFQIEYLKKARGKLTAKCQVPVQASDAKAETRVKADIFDANGNKVCFVEAKWLVGDEPTAA